MSNRPTIAQAVQMSVTEVSSLPTSILGLLLEDVAEMKAAHKKADDHLFAALSHRFGDRASEARKAKGTDTGTVRFTDDDCVVVADLPKRVTWDGAGLVQVSAQLKDMGEPVSDYIQTKMDVAEKAYSSWPGSLKKLFDPHRTLGVGKASFKIEPKKDSV
jgi:hypothetical protein